MVSDIPAGDGKIFNLFYGVPLLYFRAPIIVKIIRTHCQLFRKFPMDVYILTTKSWHSFFRTVYVLNTWRALTVNSHTRSNYHRGTKMPNTLAIHRKKGQRFSRPHPDVTNQTLPGREYFDYSRTGVKKF